MSLVRPLLLLLMLVALSLSVHAAPVEVKSLAVQDSIIPGEQAAFDIRITNNQDFKDTFRIAYDDVFWDLTSDPLYHYFSGVDIRSGDSETVRLYLNPLGDDLDYGLYRVDLKVRSGKGRNVEEIPVFITLRPEKPLIREYLAAVSKIVDVPSVVYPNETLAVRVNLRNRNPKNLSDVKVVFSSSLMSREVQTSLEPLEARVVEEQFTLDPLTPPQEGVLNVKLFVDDRLLEPEINEPFAVGAYSEIAAESSLKESSFLRSVESSVYVNRGNVVGSRSVEVSTNYFKNIFTETSPEAFDVKKGERRLLVWELALAPSESVTITRTVSYRPLFVVLLILASAGVLYYLTRSPVYAVKRASVLSFREGGISEIKVIVHVRNRSSQPFERLTVTDTIPMLASVIPDSAMGARPSSVYNDGSKTVVKWEIDKLEKREERLLTYRVQSRLAILGDVTLPPVSMRFYSMKGSKLVSKSRPATVKV